MPASGLSKRRWKQRNQQLLKFAEAEGATVTTAKTKNEEKNGKTIRNEMTIKSVK